MESNLPVISKRVWSIVCVVYIMLRKGFTKRKLLMDLNLLLKRPGKFAGKAFAKLISHHHPHGSSAAASHDLRFTTAREYEFRCSNTHSYSFFSKRHPRRFFSCAHALLMLDGDVSAVNSALKVTLGMLNDKKYSKDAVEKSPALSEFGRTTPVRQLRVTDSPIPMQEGNHDGDHQVDMAAEEFINRFFRELRKQG